VVSLVRAFFWHVDVSSLHVGKSAELCIKFLQLQHGYFLVQMLGQGVNANRIFVAALLASVHSSICAMVWLAKEELIT